MKVNSEFVETYAGMAPLALAFERALECRILSKLSFERPVLDIGCGEGLFAEILFTEKIDVGIDPNARELDRARELDAYDVLVECKGDAIPEAAGRFRTVLSNSVIEHIPDIEPVLREAHRLLASGGRLYVTVPSDRFDEYSFVSQLLALLRLHGLQRRFRAFYNRFWAHYHYYPPEGWAKIVETCGFVVIEVHSYAPRRVCLMNDMLVAFSVPAFFIKRFTNRWTLFPRLRRILLTPAIAVGKSVLTGAERCDGGGLVFLAARKP